MTRLLLSIYFILPYLTGMPQKNIEIDFSADYFLSIKTTWSDENTIALVTVKDEKSTITYEAVMAIEGQNWSKIQFPNQFILMDGEEIQEDDILDLKLSIYIKKTEIYTLSFHYNPSPNTSLQLEPFNFTSKQKEKLSIWGQLIDAYQWYDLNGKNIVARSFIEKNSGLDNKSEDRDKYIYLYHFLEEKEAQKNLKLIRKFTDAITSCSDSLAADFKIPSIELTDINKDTIGEVSHFYYLDCINGDETVRAKLLLTTNGEKYMIRGDSPLSEEKNNYNVSHTLLFKEEYHRFMTKKWEEITSSHLKEEY